jgi:hypothetical protein
MDEFKSYRQLKSPSPINNYKPKENVMSRLKILSVQIIALLLVSGFLAALAPPRSAAASQDLIFPAVADTYVSAAAPTVNYGTQTTLRTDNSPVVTSYLRFNVSGLAGRTVTAASLAIHANSASTSGLALKSVANTTWSETAINFNTAPVIGPQLSSVSTVASGAWIAFNVKAYITQDGLFSFAVTTPGAQAISLSSRESSGFIPKLTITVDTAGAPSQTPVTPGVTPPTPTQKAPTPTPTQITGTGDPVLVGAGDISSCSSTGDETTANLLDTIPGTIFTAGDNVYESGTASEFSKCYGPSWGRFKARTMPDPGNHDYNTSGGSGYYGYFGSAAGSSSKGYYSYNLGAWHIIALNGEISHSAGSAQETWLRKDLAANSNACTLAIWHEPLFSSGSTHGSNSGFKALWQALYDYHADVVVNGHEHNYERFAPQTPAGVAAANGIREFVVGTGGRSHYPFGSILANSQVHNGTTYGVLKLTLHANSYDWQFVPVAGQTFKDSGTTLCNP